MVIAFLCIPKCTSFVTPSFLDYSHPPTAEKEHRDSNEFRKFRRKIFHTSLASIFKSIRHAMLEPVKVKCNDGKYRRAIFGFGPYIGDYPEQCLLACIVQGWCPTYVS